MRIPFRKAEIDAKRYIVIAATTGALDLLAAFTLLRAGFSPAFSLGLSIAIAGAANYFALEWWGQPGRSGAFSLRRLAESGLVELGTYLIRLGALWAWKRLFPVDSTPNHLVDLCVAYSVAFVFGYIIRSRIIFTAPEGT